MKKRGAQPLVLVVDEDRDACDFYLASLSYEGFRCIQASHADAFERTLALLPDLIIIDAPIFSVANGNAVQRLKHDPRTRAIPIVIASAHAREQHRDNAMLAGADGFFRKPVDLCQLTKQMRRLVTHSPRLEQRAARKKS
jgi:two-component system chemotaxis response regulator CheY